MAGCSRRGFILSAASCAAALSRLSAGVEVAEPFTVSEAMVTAGASKPFSLLHISDTHLTCALPSDDERLQALSRSRVSAFGGCQEDALRAAFAWAAGNADFVVHTGDIVDFVSKGNLELVRKWFGGRERFLECPGNHEYGFGDSTFAQRGVYVERLRRAFPHALGFSSQIVNGVNLVMLDDAFATVTADQVRKFRQEAARGLPIVLCKHVPYYTSERWRQLGAFGRRLFGSGIKYGERQALIVEYERRLQHEDPVTRDFIAYLRQEPLLKCVLAGHAHVEMEERFSPTAMQYVVGANFNFRGRRIRIV